MAILHGLVPPLWTLPHLFSLSIRHHHCSVLCLVAQSCLTISDPMDCSPPGSSVCRDSPGKNPGVGCQVLLQGIFPAQELNQGLLHCRWILYQLSNQGSPHLCSAIKYQISLLNSIPSPKLWLPSFSTYWIFLKGCSLQQHIQSCKNHFHCSS